MLAPQTSGDQALVLAEALLVNTSVPPSIRAFDRTRRRFRVGIRLETSPHRVKTDPKGSNPQEVVMRSWIWFLAVSASLAPSLCSPVVSPARGAGEPEWDVGVTGCTYTQEEPGLITLLLETDVILPDRDGEWEIPIRILFNGVQVEGDQIGKLGAETDNLVACPPPNDEGNCYIPAEPCGTTTKTYKGVDRVFKWPCNWVTDHCQCQRITLLPATWVKGAVAPQEAGVFEFILDPENVVPELDEENNVCLLSYEPMTSSVPAEDPASRTLRLVSTGPNPFRGTTSFLLALSSATEVSVDVYGIGGRSVRTLTHGVLEAGGHPLSWDGRNGDGAFVPSGIYFVRARTADDRVSGQRVIRLEQ